MFLAKNIKESPTMAHIGSRNMLRLETDKLVHKVGISYYTLLLIQPYKCQSSTIQLLFHLCRPTSHIHICLLPFKTLLHQFFSVHMHNPLSISVNPIALPFLLSLQSSISTYPYAEQLSSIISLLQNLIHTMSISFQASDNHHMQYIHDYIKGY